MTSIEQPLDPQFFALQEALAGKYSLEAELGRGGMGIVYLAQEVQLDRPVALKVLPQELSSKADLRERFLREARTAAKLSHPNIIPIFAVDEVGEFVCGIRRCSRVALPSSALSGEAGQVFGRPERLRRMRC